MLLLEKMMHLEKVSASQKAVINFMIESKREIEFCTARDIAKRVFTSPATLTRLSKKLGYSGFEDLKKAFLKEQEYLDKHMSVLDANHPFRKNDNNSTIANSIGNLIKESVDDTLSLIDYDQLNGAVKTIEKADTLHISAISFSLIYAMDFQLKMRRLGKNVEITELVGEQLYTYSIIRNNDCAMVISYSGEIPLLKQMMQVYRQRGVPVIAITSLGENSIRKYADVTIDICTREKLYTKIAGFTSQASIKLILDILYSCYFNLQYDKNMECVHMMGKLAEPGRFSTTDILNENKND